MCTVDCRPDPSHAEPGSAMMGNGAIPARIDRSDSSKESNNRSRPQSSMDSCAQELVSEGFDLEKVLRALEISQNNVYMAREILVNFV